MISASEAAQNAITAPPNGTTVSQGTNGSRGRGRGRRGGRGGRGPGPARTNFRGTTDDMNGQVFECYEEKSDRRQLLDPGNLRQQRVLLAGHHLVRADLTLIAG